MSCSRRGSHLLHGNDCRPVVYVVASVEDLDAIAHLGRAELGRGRRRGPPGRRPRPASWIFRCHGGFFIMLAGRQAGRHYPGFGSRAEHVVGQRERPSRVGGRVSARGPRRPATSATRRWPMHGPPVLLVLPAHVTTNVRAARTRHAHRTRSSHGDRLASQLDMPPLIAHSKLQDTGALCHAPPLLLPS